MIHNAHRESACLPERPPESGNTAALLRRRYLAHLLLASALLLCALLLFYPPTRTSFYPACPIHQYLHIDCPGCGVTRALAALLHGRIAEAIRLNALFVLLLPVALAVAIESYHRAMRPGHFRLPQPPASTVYASIGLAIAFTIVRNLPR